MSAPPVPDPRPPVQRRGILRVPRSVRRSATGRRLLARRRHRLTRREVRRHPDRFAQVTTCCLFIGHVKSGGSLVGAMLDAHPRAVLADEVDVVAQVEAGLDREQIFTLLLRGARREARDGRVTARRLEPYSLAVPGRWQGRYEQLEVIGDTRAGPTTRRLGDDPERLDRLRAVVGDRRLAFVHVVRNPYEPIGAMVRRSGRTISDAIDDHRGQCRRLDELRARVPAGDLLTLRYEDLVADPRRHLAGLLAFLGLEGDDGHLDACAALLRPEAVRERDRIDWTRAQRDEVGATIAAHDFLAGYGYDG
jgi:hypothetical protein